MHSGDWSWGFGSGHGIVGLVFWLIILVVLGALFAGLFGGGGRRERRSARDILKERYARGEIEREEYERKLQDLDR